MRRLFKSAKDRRTEARGWGHSDRVTNSLFLGRWTLILAVFGLLSLFAGGIAVTHAVGLIPAEDGTIHACFKTDKENKKDKEKQGNLRVVSSHEKCKKNETAIWWNQEGSGPTADDADGAGGFYSYSLQTASCGGGDSSCTATCPVGHKVLGGGYYHGGGSIIPPLQRNGPIITDDGKDAWQVTASVTQTFTQFGVTIFATCADTG